MSDGATTEGAGSDTPGTAESGDDESGGYGGLLGAYPYAFRRSESRLFRAYALAGGLLAALVALLFLLALVRWVAATVGGPASITLSRAFLVIIGLAVFAPLVAPVLLVARHQRGLERDGEDPDAGARYDAAVGACGFLFVVAGYLGLVLASPDAVVTGRLRALGAVPPLVAVAVIWVTHRRLR